MKRKISFILLMFLMMTMVIPMKTALASQNNVELEEREERDYELKFFIDERYGYFESVSIRYKCQSQITEEINYGRIHASTRYVDKTNGTEISVIINKDEFKESDNYIFLIYTDKYLFPVYLDDLLKEEVMELVPNSEYASLPQVEIENSGGINTQKLKWDIVTDEGKNLGLNIDSSSRLYEDIKVPYGKYNLHLISDDDKNYYSLFKTNIDINENTDIIKFTKNELCQVNVQFNTTTTSSAITLPINNTTTSSAVKIEHFTPVANGLSEEVYYDELDRFVYELACDDVTIVPDNVEKIYTTRNVKASSTIGIEVEEGWKYYYSTSELDFNREVVDIDVSTEFSMNSYMSMADNNEKVEVVNEIVDSYGNSVPLITDHYGEWVENIIEISDDDVIFNYSKSNSHTFIFSTWNLNGEYYITSKINEKQIPIKETSKKIIVKEGYVEEIDGEPQLSNNAYLKSIKIDNVEIEGFWWSIYTYTTSLSPNQIPKITAEAQHSNAKIDIIYPSEEKNYAIINVISESGLNSRTYKIIFEKILSVTLDVDYKTLIEGEILQLNAAIEPSDAENKNLFWSSSNEEIASVNENGLVTAKKKGTVKITVRTEDGNKFDYCRINVEEPEDIEEGTYEINFFINEEFGEFTSAKVYHKLPILVNEQIRYETIFASSREFNKINGVELSILINKDNYRESDKYVFLICTDKYLFPVYLSELSNNKEIELVPNEKYHVLPEVKVQESDNFKDDYSVFWNMITDDGIPLSFSTPWEYNLYKDFKVPFGKYNIQLNGSDDKNYYSLFKTDIDINENTDMIEFSKDELCEVNIRMENTLTSTFENLEYVAFSAYDIFNSIHSIHINDDSKKILTTRNIKASSTIKMVVGEGWTFKYSTNQIDFNREKVDIDLSTELSISPVILTTGKIFNSVKDSYGNSVICGRYENDVYFKDSIEVRDINNELVDVPKDKEYSMMWDIQGLNGEYYVTSRVENCTIPFEEVTKKILVKNGKVLEIDGVPQFDEENKVTNIRLDKHGVNLKEGQTVQLNAFIEPENADKKNLIWSSYNNEIASVDENGLVTAKKVGTVTIKVESEDGKKFDTCIIEIEKKNNSSNYIPRSSNDEKSISKSSKKIDIKKIEKEVEKKYINHTRLKSLEKVNSDKEFKIRVSKSLYNDRKQESFVIDRINQCFKLIDMNNQEEKEFIISFEDDKTIKLKPKFKLKKGHVYLLVIDKSFSVNGNQLKKGSTCIITVK